MVTRTDLKSIVILGYLSEAMIEKLLPEIELLRFTDGEIIFREGDPADMFYMLKRGKILLEKRISEKLTISMGTVKPGYAFGWSGMLGDERFSVDTVCGEPCEVLRIRTTKLFDLIEHDYEMGYRLMHRLLHMVRRRLDGRTELLLKVIVDHPDIEPLLDNN